MNTSMRTLKIFMYLSGPSRIISRNGLTKTTNYINGMARSISTVDSKDIKHLSSYKNKWWDENGPMFLLHSFVPIRVQFIRDGLANAGFKTQNLALPLEGIKIVDIGCGGGILTERLARIGAQMTGIDAALELINIAEEHVKLDSNIFERVKYIHTTVEEFSQKNEELYDAVVASEVVEHVINPELFLKECVKILKPGGSIFITTVNRTLISWLVTIVGAEYVLRFIPLGTHEWNKFIAPHEVQRILDNYGCKTKLIHGIQFNPLTMQFFWWSCTANHYGLHAIKQKISGPQ